jgi:hypothetical protein
VDSCSWSNVADAFDHVAAALGLLAGGIWTLWRFDLFRRREAALSMSLSCASTAYRDNQVLVAMNATIKNTGKVMIRIRKKRPAYPHESGGDKCEKLNFGASILLRPVRDSIALGKPVRWFENTESKSPLDGDIELDLVSGYEKGGSTDFWMEPGEAYGLGSAVVLSPGLYLAMVTVVGENTDDDFWRREYILGITATSSGKCVVTPQDSA